MQFDYARPRTLSEALAALAAVPGARVLAGGTDILVEIQEGRAAPPLLVDLARIEGMDGIRIEGGTVTIGALVTHARIAADPRLAHQARPLALGCAEIGSPQIRARGTLGGNLVNSSPAADAIPGLMALETSVLLASAEGERELPLEEFLLGVKKNAMRPGEILLSVRFPAMGPGEGGFFLKLGQRKSLAIAKVSAAGRVALEGSLVSAARIALGAVATTVIRARAAEEYLIGRRLNPDTIAEAAGLAAEESRAITDIRSAAGYRDEMAGVLVGRGLESVLQETCSLCS